MVALTTGSSCEGMSISGSDCTTNIIALVHCIYQYHYSFIGILCKKYPHTILTSGMTNEQKWFGLQDPYIIIAGTQYSLVLY